MCGRYVLHATQTEIVNAFALDAAPDAPPRYNIAPTQPIVVVRPRAVPEGSNLPPREAVLARWGLIPPWAKPGDKLPLLINARSETAAQKASFRAAMRRRRVLVPISGFYEWKRTDVGGRKPLLEPFYVRPRDGGLLALAGLMESGAGEDGEGNETRSAAILTAEASADFAPIHHRMPVVIGPSDFGRWLDCEAHGAGDVADLLHAPEEGFFEPVPVSDKVNKVSNQGPELMAPVARVPAAPPAAATLEPAEPEPSQGAEPLQGSLF